MKFKFLCPYIKLYYNTLTYLPVVCVCFHTTVAAETAWYNVYYLALKGKVCPSLL